MKCTFVGFDGFFPVLHGNVSDKFGGGSGERVQKVQKVQFEGIGNTPHWAAIAPRRYADAFDPYPQSRASDV